ncbi:disrupted in schizophrenia 1 protein [Osmerus mordax]|uniref:disrupted in schizophrenia 1 protein n=1 Tax=Osmerus mordax TaxID=8014 RepID=UPI00350F088A
MFAGLMTLEFQGGPVLPSESAGSLTRKRLQRRPGCVRPDLPRPQSSSSGEDGSTTCLQNGVSGSAGGEDRDDIIPEPTNTMSVSRQRPALDELSLGQCRHILLSSSAPCLPQEGCGAARPPSRSQDKPFYDLQLTPGLQPGPAQPRLPGPGDTFRSSFSFIQQSLTSTQGAHTVPELRISSLEPADQSSSKTLPSRAGLALSVQQEPECVSSSHPTSKTPGDRSLRQPGSVPGQSEPGSAPPSQSELGSAPPSQSELSLGERLWQDRHWEGREAGGCTSVTSDLKESLPDSDSMDTEAASSVSLDSDAATSGYDSAPPGGEPGWGSLLKTYEGALQACLQNTRTSTKIESMMLKLQRLQQKAVLEDDYDSAERFGKKLDELSGERARLQLDLPSRQPGVSLLLQRLGHALHSTLRRTQDATEGRDADLVQVPQQRRVSCLLQEKRQVEVEMQALRRRLEDLEERRRRLEQQEQQEEELRGSEEAEESLALRGRSAAQLRDMSRTLDDLVTCKSRSQMTVWPPASTLRLQEQEQELSLSIKEATAKVVMSQRLGASLRRKVSETETQLLALHEAKLAAVSGNDFSSARELKAEMRGVYAERERLEGLAKRLHSLSAGNSQELARMKEQQQQLKQELEESVAQHERSLKENALKYIRLLEDRVHSCGCPVLERVWEADLEACHLLLRGLQLRSPACSGMEGEDPPAMVGRPATQGSKQEQDCAMLTALGGRWGPDANLQNSEFTKKLEEFLFSMEDNHPEDGCSEAADLTEQCELISDRLMTLEEDLQTAMLSRDQALTQSLEVEVKEVKAALQSMLVQLKGEEEEEEEEEGDYIVENKKEEEEDEEEEDQYFSDSWEI